MSPSPRFVQPKSDTIYRISNVDSGLYLERGKAFAPQMRPDKITSKRQHWKFILVNNSLPVTYRIEDPYPGEDPTTALYCDLEPLETDDPTQESYHYNTWIFDSRASEENAVYLLANQDPPVPVQQLLGNNIQSKDNPVLRLVMREKKGKQLLNDNLNYQWEISEVSPARLPDGENSKYRIRAFLGKPLQVDTAGNINLDTADARGEHRVWTISDLGNGRCTVFHEQTKKFLTAMDKGNFNWQPALKSETDAGLTTVDRLWIFERTTEFSYAIFLDRWTSNNQRAYFALALEGNNVILKPKKPAHNQVWFVEAIDAARDGPIPPPVPPSPPAPPEPPAPGTSAFPPGLKPNVLYKISNPNVTSQSYLYITATWNGSMLTGYTVSTGGSLTNSVEFSLETKDQGVVLYTVYLNQRYYLGVENGSVVTNQLNDNDKAYVWTVTRVSQEASGGRYLISLIPLSKNGNNQFLASPATGTSLELVAQEDLQNPMQIWAFTTA